jgi:methylmalonyl-CoA mutase C-terminal domain/subunit
VAERPIRVVLAKLGLDGHDRGSRIVASWLRDAGMEVIYTGPWQTIESVVSVSTQEDVDLIGISSLATDHLLVPKLMKALDEARMHRVSVIVGGIVPDQDEQMLLDCGVARVFHPGTGRDELVEAVRGLVARARDASGSRHQEAGASPRETR